MFEDEGRKEVMMTVEDIVRDRMKERVNSKIVGCKTEGDDMPGERAYERAFWADEVLNEIWITHLIALLNKAQRR